MLLAEIAKAAKVSPSTVSRAINQPEIVAPESLERIRAVMQAHDYQPPPINRRRGPKSRKPSTLRLAVWFVGAKEGNPALGWFQEKMSLLQDQSPINRVDLNMVFSSSPADLPRQLVQDKFDGVIIQGMEPAAEVMEALQDTPTVWFMTRRSASFPGDYVEPNNEENGQLAANHLASQGHRHVAVLSIDPAYSAVSRRTRAFELRARELGLTTHRILGRQDASRVSYLEIDPLNTESTQLVDALTALSPRPTGLYAPVDHFAGSLLRALRLAGLQPERDYELILGNYNPIIYNNLEHHPAVIDINLAVLIRKVIAQLVWRIENRDCPGRISVSVSPVLRPALLSGT
ncbi:LacI family DNA-binding transcriptional regulator [Actomonas aquatica]|uniref:LacI family DNA-binding transcriptional regulator n=1 Tax=Actomonas aquatica TaxID=2866162 RepID=A0ABZ1C3H5_9BACT|nr:LacI family DNA-binding transcriptional regulator [Opitutus sp. WL0086]WRQ86046.1 LacI family DNA-binding transcriptional regulator [Opitutus sp. WL0086]